MTSTKEPATSTAIVPVDQQFPILSNYEDLVEAIEENVGDGLSPTDLTRYRQVGSGVEMFVNVDTGEVADSIEGVMVAWGRARSYWEGDTPTDGRPPQCASTDGKTATGIRWEGDTAGPHECAACPLAQFGSATKNGSEGQACNEFRQVLILEPNHYLPSLIRVPSTSIKTFTRYMVAELTSIGKPFYSVVTKITLKSETSKAGFATAIMRFTAVIELPPELRTGAQRIKKALAAGWKPPVVVGVTAGPNTPTGDEEPF